MANSSAKFDAETPPMSEAESGPIDMDENPEQISFQHQNPEMDLDEPPPNQTEIRFDETGQMIQSSPTEEPALQLAKETPVSPEPEAVKTEDGPPTWFEPYAESQKKMAEYFEWQRSQQEQYQTQQQNYADSQQQAYYRSPEYITQVCEMNQFDPEDPVHRRLVETELRGQFEKQKYEDRLSRLESANQEAAVSKRRMSAQEELAENFNQVANTYENVPEEMVEAARNQALKLARLGVNRDEAITESLQFVRMAAQTSSPASRATSSKQARIDQLNSAGPGRGASSHRKQTEMSMADADMLVSRGGFFPN